MAVCLSPECIAFPALTYLNDDMTIDYNDKLRYLDMSALSQNRNSSNGYHISHNPLLDLAST